MFVGGGQGYLCTKLNKKCAAGELDDMFMSGLPRLKQGLYDSLYLESKLLSCSILIIGEGV